ncbi:glycosyltransferase [Niveibacterium sp.]|uniref:glycosyltransferase n=1 Tax=Niveibacterium sp. TaxID=2017444 RepID=UPI0035AE8A9B
MTLSDTHTLYADALAGRRNLVAWGAAGLLPLFLMQLPCALHAIIDANAPEDDSGQIHGIPLRRAGFLAQLDPATTVIVLFAEAKQFGAQIAEQVARYGAFPIVLPYIETRDGPPQACNRSAELLARLRLNRQLREELAASRAHRYEPVPRRALLWIGRLAKGGAERQVTLLAVALRQAGWEVDLVTVRPNAPHTEGWAAQLAEAGVERIVLPGPRDSWQELLSDTPARLRALSLAKWFMAKGLHAIGCTYDVLRQRRPELVVGYMDEGSIVASVAAILAGTPAVLMSGRAHEPNTFPDVTEFPVDKPYLPTVYRALLRQAGVHLSNNSRAGADSYARWLRLPTTKVTVVHNAIEPLSHEGAAQLRARYGIAHDALLMLGVMRLEEEKDPLGFIHTFHALHRLAPRSHALLVGDGSRRGAVEQLVNQLGLRGHLTLAGAQSNPGPFYAVADFVMISSRTEGLCNVALEGQVADRPVFAADVGGIREALAPCLHPYLVRHGEWVRLAETISTCAASAGACAQLGQVAGQYIRNSFSMQQLAAETIAAACARDSSLVPHKS